MSNSTTSPVLSVIVPVYNEERTVDALLRLLSDGLYADKEIIVMDNASSTRGSSSTFVPWRGQGTGFTSTTSVPRRLMKHVGNWAYHS